MVPAMAPTVSQHCDLLVAERRGSLPCSRPSDRKAYSMEKLCANVVQQLVEVGTNNTLIRFSVFTDARTRDTRIS